MSENYHHVHEILMERIKSSRILLLVLGIMLTISGLLFIAFTNIATITSVFLFGFVMIFGGALQVIASFSLVGWRRWVWLLFGLLYGMAGVFAFKAPLATASVLTWLLAVFLIAGGIVRITSAFQLKQIQGWGWLLISGILLLVTGFLIGTNPTSPLWVLGLMLGLDLFIQGINLLTLASIIRKL